MSNEKLDELLSAITSKISTLIGMSLIVPHLKAANGDLVQLGLEIDELINEYMGEE